MRCLRLVAIRADLMNCVDSAGRPADGSDRGASRRLAAPASKAAADRTGPTGKSGRARKRGKELIRIAAATRTWTRMYEPCEFAFAVDALGSGRNFASGHDLVRLPNDRRLGLVAVELGLVGLGQRRTSTALASKPPTTRAQAVQHRRQAPRRPAEHRGRHSRATDGKRPCWQFHQVSHDRSRPGRQLSHPAGHRISGARRGEPGAPSGGYQTGPYAMSGTPRPVEQLTDVAAVRRPGVAARAASDPAGYGSPAAALAKPAGATAIDGLDRRQRCLSHCRISAAAYGQPEAQHLRRQQLLATRRGLRAARFKLWHVVGKWCRASSPGYGPRPIVHSPAPAQHSAELFSAELFSTELFSAQPWYAAHEHDAVGRDGRLEGLPTAAESQREQLSTPASDEPARPPNLQRQRCRQPGIGSTARAIGSYSRGYAAASPAAAVGGLARRSRLAEFACRQLSPRQHGWQRVQNAGYNAPAYGNTYLR